jgi:predicted FMN-binding regulatory protein PaiB
VSQNRSQADQEGVIRNLQSAGDADSHDMAAMLSAWAREHQSPNDR